MELALEDEMDVQWVLEKISGPKARSAPRPKFEAKPDQAGRKSNEVELWHAWNDSGRKKELLNPLIKSFQPMIQSKVNIYKNKVEVPTSIIEHNYKEFFYDAMATWDPKKGSLQTWVGWNLRRGGREIDSLKNFARIPENITKNIGAYNSIKAELTEKLGHEPDDQTMHDYILETGHEKLGRLSLRDLRRIGRDQRKGLIQQGHESDPGQYDPREEELIHTIHYQLSPQERIVHEYSFGINGKPKLSSGAIAKKLNMDPSKVSKIRTVIRKKIKAHLEE